MFAKKEWSDPKTRQARAFLHLETRHHRVHPPLLGAFPPTHTTHPYTQSLSPHLSAADTTTSKLRYSHTSSSNHYKHAPTRYGAFPVRRVARS